ncbi:hypothetical protein EDD21DRAFT_448958 [Dissophora ornata]|nr:hypothetical protein EDD21DRAFT_448958 [Dissophora ornata]
MSLPLSRRKKAELKELALSLGLSDQGVREDLVERIKSHITHSGDPSLQRLIRSSRESSPALVLTTTPNDIAESRSRSRSSSSSSSSSSNRNINASKNLSTENTSPNTTPYPSSNKDISDLLPEHEVRDFMEHMQDELHDASDLAKELQETLRGGGNSVSSTQRKSVTQASNIEVSMKTRNRYGQDTADDDVEDEELGGRHRHGSEYRRQSPDRGYKSKRQGHEHGTGHSFHHRNGLRGVVTLAQKSWRQFQEFGFENFIHACLD